jgi:membrane fusion protein, heavy metal efflux system
MFLPASSLSTRGRFITGAALVLLLTVAVTLVWAHEGHAPLPTKGAQVDLAHGQVTLSRQAGDALDVRTAEVESQTVEEKLLAYATLESPWQRHAFASSRLPGRIVRLLVQAGQTVTAGQPLAEVQSPDLENLLLDLRNAQNDVRLSEEVLKGVEESARTGSTPLQTLLEARSRHRQNVIALEVGRGKWLSLGLGADDLDTLLRARDAPPAPALPVRSPVAGTVIHADLAAGKVVAPAEHLFEVVDLSTVWVRADVLEKDLPRITVGQPLELQLPAYPGEVFRAAVQVKGSALDARTHLGTAWAELTNPAGSEPHFLPGMRGQAQLLLPARPAATVPVEAVIDDGSERYVLVEETAAAGGSQYRRQNVVTGRRTPDRVEVLSGGLFPGDRVVTRGAHELAGFFVPGVLRPSPEARRNLGVRVEPVEDQVVEDVLEMDGAVTLPADRRAVASAQLGGTLAKINVGRGQAVRAGDVVAEVASLELQSLQLDLLRAHLEGRLLEDNLERLKAATTVPRRQVLEAESQLNANRNRRDNLARQLQAAGLSPEQLDAVRAGKSVVETLPVRAPLDGVVVSFDRVLGQAVKAEEPLFEIHDLSRPLVQGFVAEAELARVRLSQAVRVRFTAEPGFVAEGTVVRSGRVVGTEDRTLSVWVEQREQPPRLLLNNQLARLVLTVGRPAPTLAVPLGAVGREGTRAFVFVEKEDGSFERRAVETGRADDLRVEVTRGLRQGERVAVAGVAGLQTAYAVVR